GRGPRQYASVCIVEGTPAVRAGGVVEEKDHAGRSRSGRRLDLLANVELGRRQPRRRLRRIAPGKNRSLLPERHLASARGDFWENRASVEAEAGIGLVPVPRFLAFGKRLARCTAQTRRGTRHDGATGGWLIGTPTARAGLGEVRDGAS